ncbi:hypothetical protein [Campylobacter showae]|jgi:hypothetical protein|uniref:hypothetical protein n=1 Tax=Campylobacter showae TaxID=204 RepID=UPI001F145909|nr:hypothetical protein [Campylobacter showae]
MKKANLACAPLLVARILGKFGSINLTRLQAEFDENLKFESKFCGADGFLNLIQICQICSNLTKSRANLTKTRIRNGQSRAKTRLAIFPPTPALRRQNLNPEIQKKEKINEPKFTKRPSFPARISSTLNVLAST